MNHIKLFESFNSPMNESDSDKLEFSRKYADMFFEYCLKNINKITKKLMSDAYYEFKIDDLNIEISIDDLVNSNGQRTLGEYDDESLTLRIGLFDYFKKFLLPIDGPDELSNDEKDIIEGGIKNILTNANNEFAQNIQNNIRQIFYHEMVHHYDNIKYGNKYSTNAHRLELIKSEIKDIEKRTQYYINMPHEIDANFISSLARLIDNHGKNYGDFQIFSEMFFNYFPMFDKLSDDNKIKVNKRLYRFFGILKN